jgi:hypothetical protein
MPWNPLRARRERKLAEVEQWRTARKLVTEDVTVFGEELAGLHEETLATPLDADMRRDYQRALDLYDDAKRDLVETTTAAEVGAVEKILDDGRFRLACVLARRDGVPLPERREPCFFNPQHGPAVTDIAWTPPGGVEREVPVCRRDRDRLTAGEEPDVRVVRVGDRYVPWWQANRGAIYDGLTGYVQGGLTAHVHGGHALHSKAHLAEAELRSAITRGGGGGLFGR